MAIIIGDDFDNALVDTTGKDQMFGGLGNDTLTSTKGRDSLFGGGGNDSLSGLSAERAIVHGDDGNDIIFADNFNAGYGDARSDTLAGSGTLSGDADNDSIISGLYSYGEDGDDTLSGDTGYAYALERIGFNLNLIKGDTL